MELFADDNTDDKLHKYSKEVYAKRYQKVMILGISLMSVHLDLSYYLGDDSSVRFIKKHGVINVLIGDNTISSCIDTQVTSIYCITHKPIFRKTRSYRIYLFQI